MNRFFEIPRDGVPALFPASLDCEVLSEIFRGFCPGGGALLPLTGSENEIRLGKGTCLPLDEEDEFSLSVTEDGVGIAARTPDALARGFSAFLLQLRATGETPGRYVAPVLELHGRFSVARRMIHFCVFPNTTLPVLRRLVRLCGVLSYTHVVLEFWGMLRFDRHPELAWENAYTKEEIAPILREARALGVEPVPMFNHLGHAAACRLDSGKHVVLDRHPELQYLFTPDGWCWDIFSEAPRTLLRDVREELYDLFGEGSYFHIGCDEAHLYSSEYYPIEGLSDFLSTLSREVLSEGRRPILWGDMLVPLDLNADTEERRQASLPMMEKMRPVLDALPRECVIADWHYDTTAVPVRTSLIFKEMGFPVLGCPWDKRKNVDAHYKTAIDYGTDGLMMTTWHTLHTGMSTILHFARKCGLSAPDWAPHAGHRNLEIATILRKLSPPEGLSYADCGFCARQLHDTFAW